MNPLKRCQLALAWILALTVGNSGLGGLPSRGQAAANPAPNERVVESDAARPAAHLIPGVPFVAWREAAGWNYPGKEFLNPSVPAAQGMVLAYWGQDPRRADTLKDWTKIEDWSVEDSIETGSLELLQSFLARGIPVIVITALTPLGHPLAGAAETFIAMGMAPAGVEPVGPYSGTLGKFVTLEGHHMLRDSLKINPIRESLTAAARVAVGYDNQRHVVVLHDPTFGPAWEMSYDDFERTWAANNYAWLVAHPKVVAGEMGYRADHPQYRPRTPDEVAVEHFVYGYALSSSGNLLGGEGRFRQGLATAGISKGHRFLLLFELALTLGEEERFDQAVSTAEEAAGVLPEHPGPWSFLRQAYLVSAGSDAKKKAEQAGRKAQEVGKDLRSQRLVAAAVPCDFWVMNLTKIRGWCVR